jgi:hypothetical protein
MSAGERRVGARGWVAWGLAAAMALEPATAAASAAIATTGAMVAPTVPHALYKKKKKKKAKKKVEGPAKIGPEVTTESANTKREAIRAAAKGDADAGNFAAAAKTLEDNGAILGDPVVYLEAADLRLRRRRRIATSIRPRWRSSRRASRPTSRDITRPSPRARPRARGW